MSNPRTSLLVFFPSRPLVRSPFHPYREEAIREVLQQHLRSDPSIIDGYEVSESGGCWHDGQGWHSDANWVIRTYMRVSFAQGLADPSKLRSPEKQYLVRLARMSCVDMGHAEFFAIFNNNSAIRGNPDGLFVGPNGKLISYKDILD